MRLYILRHGKAQKDSPTGRDEDRPLAPKGHDQARFLADAFLLMRPPLDVRPARIISSTAARAQATARAIAQTLGLDIQHEEAILPERPVGRAAGLVADLCWVPGHEAVLLVGHNPQFEALLRHLAGEQAPGRLRTGELAALEAGLRDQRPAARFIACIRADDED